MLTRAERKRFDALLDQVLEALPPRIRGLLEETPLIVDDAPSAELVKELGIDLNEETLCGLHSGTPLSERAVDHSPDVPETIHLFREGIVEEAGGWDAWIDQDGSDQGGEGRVIEEIRVTLLHEIGHHFGLDEDDLAELGYD